MFLLHQGTKYRELLRVAYVFYYKNYLGFALIFYRNLRVEMGTYSEAMSVLASNVSERLHTFKKD